MKKLLPLLMIVFSCGSSKQELQVEELDHCDQIKYALIWNIDANNIDWRNQYHDYITYCADDSTLIQQLAKLDAEAGYYTFFIYGMLSSSAITHYENIYENYPIGFYSPGCDESTSGLIYNKELKKLLKQNEGLDYEQIIKEEFEHEEEH